MIMMFTRPRKHEQTIAAVGVLPRYYNVRRNFNLLRNVVSDVMSDLM